MKQFVEMFRLHYSYFQKDLAVLRPELRFDEIKWRSNWFHIAGEILERYYNKMRGLKMDSKGWHNQASLDVFPGYYYLNCMLQLIARKQEVEKYRIQCLANAKQMFDPDAMDKFATTQSNYVGKEAKFRDAKDPLGGKVTLSSANHDDMMAQYKLYEESQLDLSSYILTAGQKAIGYYKQRSQIMKGPTGHMYPRMEHFINYHLSELLQPDSDEIINQVNIVTT